MRPPSRGPQGIGTRRFGHGQHPRPSRNTGVRDLRAPELHGKDATQTRVFESRGGLVVPVIISHPQPGLQAAPLLARAGTGRPRRARACPSNLSDREPQEEP